MISVRSTLNNSLNYLGNAEAHQFILLNNFADFPPALIYFTNVFTILNFNKYTGYD